MHAFYILGEVTGKTITRFCVGRNGEKRNKLDAEQHLLPCIQCFGLAYVPASHNSHGLELLDGVTPKSTVMLDGISNRPC